MVLPVSQAINAVHTVSQTELAGRAISIVVRVTSFFLQYFRVIKQGGNFVCGSKDIVKGFRTASGKWHPEEMHARVNRAYWGMVGGTTVVLGAACGLISSPLKGCMTSWDPLFFQIGDGFFMLASLIRIRNCMADYTFSQNRSDIQGMHNAALGVVASLSALLASILLLTSCPMFTWAFFCFLGATFSIIQFLHNLYHGKYNILYFNQSNYLPI